MRNKIVALSSLALSLQCFAAADADNTEVNERDRGSRGVTADQQSNDTNDMKITRRIREEIMKEKELSAYAQNVKIITIDGKVTLKGPVRTGQEQSNILKHARLVAGPSNVIDQMAVVPDKK